jgi:hypothetical protein
VDALDCVCGTGVSQINPIGALAVSEECVRTLFEARSRQREIARRWGSEKREGLDCFVWPDGRRMEKAERKQK